MFYLYKIEKKKWYDTVKYKYYDLNDVKPEHCNDYDGICMYVNQSESNTTKIINYECESSISEPVFCSDEKSNKQINLLKDVLRYLDFIGWTKKIIIIPIRFNGYIGITTFVTDVNRTCSKKSKIIINFIDSLYKYDELKTIRKLFSSFDRNISNNIDSSYSVKKKIW